MKKIIKEQGKWGILFLATFLFVKIVKNIFEQDIEVFDTIIYRMISITITPAMTAFLKVITHCGDWMVMIPTCIILMIFLKNRNQKIAVLLNLIIIFVLNQTMKLVFNRTRPSGNVLIEATGYSFPSGHSMVSMAFYGFLIYLAYKNIRNITIRNVTCIGLSMLILLIGISRIYLGVHFASDVAGGFCVSIAYLVLFTVIIKQKLENKEGKC